MPILTMRVTPVSLTACPLTRTRVGRTRPGSLWWTMNSGLVRGTRRSHSSYTSRSPMDLVRDTSLDEIVPVGCRRFHRVWRNPSSLPVTRVLEVVSTRRYSRVGLVRPNTDRHRSVADLLDSCPTLLSYFPLKSLHGALGLSTVTSSTLPSTRVTTVTERT